MNVKAPNNFNSFLLCNNLLCNHAILPRDNDVDGPKPRTSLAVTCGEDRKNIPGVSMSLWVCQSPVSKKVPHIPAAMALTALIQQYVSRG